MKIIKVIYNWLHPPVREPEVITGPTQLQAEAAIEKARRDLEIAQSQAPKIANIAERAEAQLQRNHFGEMLEYTMTLRSRT